MSVSYKEQNYRMIMQLEKLRSERDALEAALTIAKQELSEVRK